MSGKLRAWEVLKQVYIRRGYIVLAYKFTPPPLGSIVMEAITNIPGAETEGFLLDFSQPFRIMKETDYEDWKIHCQTVNAVVGEDNPILARGSNYRFYRAYTE
jgi:hypothetical protein